MISDETSYLRLTDHAQPPALLHSATPLYRRKYDIINRRRESKGVRRKGNEKLSKIMLSCIKTRKSEVIIGTQGSVVTNVELNAGY
jgi:hypothetical protein